MCIWVVVSRMIDWQHVVWDVGSSLSLSSIFSSYFSLSLPLCLSLLFPFSLSLVVWLFCGLKSHWLLCCEGALPSSIAHTGTCILPPPLLYHLHHLPRYAQASRLYLSRHCTLSLTEPAGLLSTASSYKTDVASWWDCLREAKIAGETGEASVVLCKRKSDAHQQRHFSKRLHWQNTSIRWTSPVSMMGTQLSWRPLLFLPTLQYLNELISAETHYTDICCFSHACGLISVSRTMKRGLWTHLLLAVFPAVFGSHQFINSYAFFFFFKDLSWNLQCKWTLWNISKNFVPGRFERKKKTFLSLLLFTKIPRWTCGRHQCETLRH